MQKDALQLIEELLPYKQWILSMTSGNGTELSDFKTIGQKIQTSFYFADSYASRQRGLNENTKSISQAIDSQKTIS